MSRRKAHGAAVGAAVLALALGAPVLAAWGVPGTGTGSASATSLGAPTPGSATAVSSTAVDVSFTPATGQPAGAQVRVVRDKEVGGTTLVCTQNSSPCRDTGLTAGTSYTYTLQTVLQGWRATAGATLSTSTTAILAVTTTTLPGATANTAYSQTLAASGGATPYTWSVTAGSLPDGLTLSTAGRLEGTPSTTGTSAFTVQVKDVNQQTATAQLSITVSAAQQAAATKLALSAPSNWVAGTAQTVTVSAQTASGTTDGGFTGSRSVTWGGTAFVNGPTSGTASAPSSVTFTNGVGTAQVTLYRAGSGTLTVTTSGLTAGSANVTTSAAALRTLAFTTQPPATVASGNNRFSVAVTGVDVYGNGVPGSPVTLTLNNPNGVNGAGLNGTSTATSSASGVATFTGLGVNKAGSYSLTASSGSIAATSSSFVVS